MTKSRLPVHYALDELGVREVKGPEHNPRVLEYHATTTLGDWGRSRDETPWCSSFVNWSHEEAGVEGTGNALARSWSHRFDVVWGVPCEPFPGAVIVLRHRASSSARTGSRGGYHVGYYLSRTKRAVQVLSGNTSDRVGVDKFSLAKWEIVSVRTAEGSPICI